MVPNPGRGRVALPLLSAGAVDRLVIGTRSVPVLHKLRFLELESAHAPADRQPCKRQLGTPTRPILGDDNNLVSDIKISAFKNEAANIIGESSVNIVHSVESDLFEMDVNTIYLYLGRYRVIRSLELPVGLSMHQGSLSTYHTVAYIVVLRSTYIKYAVQPRIHSSSAGTRMSVVSRLWQSSCGAGLTGICARPRGRVVLRNPGARDGGACDNFKTIQQSSRTTSRTTGSGAILTAHPPIPSADSLFRRTRTRDILFSPRLRLVVPEVCDLLKDGCLAFHSAHGAAQRWDCELLPRPAPATTMIR